MVVRVEHKTTAAMAAAMARAADMFFGGGDRRILDDRDRHMMCWFVKSAKEGHDLAREKISPVERLNLVFLSSESLTPWCQFSVFICSFSLGSAAS